MRGSLYNTLKEILRSPKKIAVIHSSLPSLVDDQFYSKWDFLNDINFLHQEGWTLCFPSFTFSFCKTSIFKSFETRSETGLLADWVLDNMPDAIRTKHPIYSFVTLGPLKSQINRVNYDSSFGNGTIFEAFEEYNADIVMMGTSWNKATIFHRYEEIKQVPYRQIKFFDGIQNDKNVSVGMFVRDEHINASNDFSQLINTLQQNRKTNAKEFGRGIISAALTQDIKTLANDLLNENIFSLVENPQAVKLKIKNRKAWQNTQPLKIALLGSSNTDIAKSTFEDELRKSVKHRRTEVYNLAFGQLPLEAHNPSSKLNTISWDLIIFVNRLEDLANESYIEISDFAILTEKLEEYLNLIDSLAKRTSNPIAVHSFFSESRTIIASQSQVTSFQNHANNLLQDLASEYSNVQIVSPSPAYTENCKSADSRLWFIGKIPFSERYTKYLASFWTSIAVDCIGDSIRLIVLDLDNTLWGGVIGEDGISGIKLGGDFPGNAFKDFQRVIKKISEKGVALAICSKNDEDVALNAIDSHQDMVIKTEDIISHRINWKPKWQNIIEISAELDLGLSSILFIDDNNLERETVRLNIPEVKILDLQPDVTTYIEDFNNNIWTQKLFIGEEDLKRKESYKSRKKVLDIRKNSASLDQFLSSLEMTIYFSVINDCNIARATQLCLKTNQFNTTTLRYSADELLDFQNRGWIVNVIGLQDKFSSKENIGLIVVNTDNPEQPKIELFLLSCRVLGRNVEKATLKYLNNLLHEKGTQVLRGEIVETERNSPARSVYADSGFIYDKKNLDWTKKIIGLEAIDWFKVVIENS